MKGTRLAASLLLLPSLAACKDGSDPQAERCAQVRAASKAQTQTFTAMGARMKQLEDTGLVEPMTTTNNTGSWWTRGTITVPGPGVEEYNTAREKGVAAFRLYERIVTNNPACFDPTTVASAQEWLASSW